MYVYLLRTQWGKYLFEPLLTFLMQIDFNETEYQPKNQRRRNNTHTHKKHDIKVIN